MKRFLLFTLKNFIILTIFIKVCSGQSYHPFPEQQAVWHVGSWEDGCPIPFPCRFDQYFYKGDTVFDGYLYHKIWLTYEALGQVYDFGLLGYLRQDSINKKVYYFSLTTTQEKLLYDFNLVTGDVYPATLICPADYFSVNRIDSIYINGDFRREYVLLPPEISGDTAKIIEGIGSVFGLINPLVHGFEYYSQLMCFQSYGETIYSPYGDSYCTVLGVPDMQSPKLNPCVSPNISSTSIRINLPSNHSTTITLFNLLGEKVKEQTITGSDITIDVSELPAGLYVVRVEGWSGKPTSVNTMVGKFVKE